MTKFKFVILWFCMILLTACGPVHVKNPTLYTLAPIHPIEIPAHSLSEKTLLVSTPIASPGYETSDMIYMLTPFQLSAYAQNRWVAPPAQMLLPVLVQMIRSVGYFKAVVSVPSVAVTDYRLDIQLLKLQQEFLLPQSRVRLEIQATLILNSSEKVIASRKFSAVIEAQNNPFGGVIAANKAVTVVGQEIAHFAANNAQ